MSCNTDSAGSKTNGRASNYVASFRGGHHTRELQIKMLLVLGDSHVPSLEAYLDPAWPVTCAGWPGARLGDERFRRWAIRTACELRPQRVLLLVGSNDLADPAFSQQRLIAAFRELSLGLLAAGADLVLVCALPPRARLRRQDVTPTCYRCRRQLANQLRHKFRRPPVRYIYCGASDLLVRMGSTHLEQAGVLFVRWWPVSSRWATFSAKLYIVLLSFYRFFRMPALY